MTRTVHAVAASAVALIGLLAAPARSNPFAGPYVGADVGYERWQGLLDRGGASYGLFAGYNAALSGRIIAGVEARIGDSDVRRSQTTTAPSFTRVVQRSIGRDIGLAARLGMRIGDSSMVFGRAGWEKVRFNTVATRTPTPPTTNPNPVIDDQSGHDDSLVLGFGVEQRVTGKVGFRLSYDYGQRFERHQLRAGVVLAF
jgi:opacity protein-like surface antigen